MILAPYARLLLVNRGDRVRFALLIGAMFIGALLETLGVGLVMPFVALVQDPARWAAIPVFRSVCEAFHAQTGEAVVSLAGGALVLTFATKNAFLWVANRAQQRFIYNRLARATARLMQSYCSLPHDQYIQTNTTDLVRIAVSEATNVFFNCIPAFFLVLVEALTAALVLSFLVFLAPVAVPIAAVVLGGATAAYFRFFRSTMTRLGEASRAHYGGMLKAAHQALEGLKEARIRGVVPHFLGSFISEANAHAAAIERQQVLTSSPRLVLELMGVSGLVMVVFIGMRGASPAALLPLLGALALAVVRLLPAAIRMVSALNTMRFGLPQAEAMLASFGVTGELPATTGAPQKFDHELRVEQLCYAYPGAKIDAVRDISLTVRRGEAIAIIGASGSGKTTLVDVICGLLKPRSGALYLDAVALDPEAMRGWQRRIGYVPQTTYLTDDTLRRNIAFGIADADIDPARLEDVVRVARLDQFVRDLPEGLDTVVGERGVRLSGGQRQRIGIARALYPGPSVLVLDEATSALDGVTEQEVVRAIEALRSEYTMIVIAHRLSTVRGCDRLALLADGAVVEVGTWGELTAGSPMFRRLVELSSTPEQSVPHLSELKSSTKY